MPLLGDPKRDQVTVPPGLHPSTLLLHEATPVLDCCQGIALEISSYFG